MPPKQKYSPDLLIKVSREIIEEKGLEGLSAREISGKLGSTTAPIFTCFGSMEELVKAVYMSIGDECRDYLLDSLSDSTSLKNFCIRWASYARNYPRFYELIFLLRGQTEELASITRTKFKEMISPVVNAIETDFCISSSDAQLVMDKMILIMTGICVNVINNVRQYSDEEISTLVGECGTTLINDIYYRNSNISVEKAKSLLK